ncbi:exosome component Rrp46 [Coprinopsis marcescibilis]|uniref:Exosome component Rrp46 n=1 Tax=Coprinopsis marcescibilis TaxID=230819 RepID=A0A5C3KQH3_COPMA|nr:exosome component Rrp46 [Coprinopsis marcescibilis]
MSSPVNANFQGDLRPISISYDGLARADGSARFGFGGTVALASVSGPIEVRLAAEQASQATLEVSVRPLSNVPATESKAQAAAIRSAITPSLILTKNPRTLIQVVIQNLASSTSIESIERDGQVAAMINSSTLALLNAGSIPMRGVVCAIAMGKTAGNEFVLDPVEEQAKQVVEGGCFAFMFADNARWTCVWTNWRATQGSFKVEDLESAREIAANAAGRVYETIKSSLTPSELP